jgi:secreted trypsin-like serine protease
MTVNGEANIGEYPWIVSVIIRNNGLIYVCGGTIITNLWILTAAHCLHK